VSKLCFILSLVLLSHVGIAILPPPNNAAALSLGGASATYLNAFAIENNVAALAFSKSEIQLNAGNRFGLSAYSNAMLVGNYNTKLASLALSYQITPLAALNQYKAQLAVAKKLGERISAGIAINYHQFTSTDVYYQNKSAITFNVGIFYQINEKLNAGFQFFNPNRSELISTPSEQMPALFRLGTNYAVGQNIKLYADGVQATDQKLNLQAGLELAKDTYKVRGGFDLQQQLALGFGWFSNNVQLDIAASYHNQLGFSPSLNIGYAF
jgi:hypothetical protein